MELSRIVFVESLFQERALSRVGAAGLWQFMPATARVHRLKVDRFRDERFDPLSACHAAASLLNRNYRELGSWPLAVTAYNAGVGKMRKAVRRVGSREIGTLIENYETAGIGFATRNFFAEFLAAWKVYENAEQYFGKIERESLFEFDLVRLPVGITLTQVAHLANSPLEELQTLNPAYAPGLFRGDYLLSSGTEIRIPPGRRELFASRFIEYIGSQPVPVELVEEPAPVSAPTY